MTGVRYTGRRGWEFLSGVIAYESTDGAWSDLACIIHSSGGGHTSSTDRGRKALLNWSKLKGHYTNSNQSYFCQADAACFVTDIHSLFHAGFANPHCNYVAGGRRPLQGWAGPEALTFLGDVQNRLRGWSGVHPTWPNSANFTKHDQTGIVKIKWTHQCQVWMTWSMASSCYQ